MTRLPWLALFVAACGADDATNPAVDAPAAPDAAPAADARDLDAAAACTSPDDCAWIDDELRTVVAVLAGAEPAAPGVTLTRRSSPTQRAQTRDYLTGRLRRLGLEPVARDYGTGQNLVVRLEPTEAGPSGPPIVVGAHFDSVPASPAAADNATGTALVVVAAGYLAGRPRRHPIELVFFDQEEIGLIGSGAYVAALVGSPVRSMHNFDMLSMDGDGDRVLELWSPAPALEALYRRHATARGFGVSPVAFTRSDHQSFVERGLPAIGVSEEFVGGDHTVHYHQPTDTLDKIDFSFLGGATRLALAAIEDDANAP
ncbi:MAG: M28 family peptidase [Kofleriaceae bacterium]|nr:M28 family peptidase [Kofleriaceae bacterium]MBP9166826.1 M28 family peptidase [Kofleriaceae bacterium]MBP9857070.1 M28 family peptidase [Kofleriaceae bacterium]